MTEVSDITARVVALVGDISGVDSASDVYPETLVSNTPFCFVEEGTATFEEIDTNAIRVTQEWILLLYVQEFDDAVTGQEDTAYQAVRPFLTAVPRHFWNRKRLQRSDQGLAGVNRSRLTRHDGIQSASRDGRLYMGAAFTLSVEYEQYADEV